jgi:hypothetical protein
MPLISPRINLYLSLDVLTLLQVELLHSTFIRRYRRALDSNRILLDCLCSIERYLVICFVPVFQALVMHEQ